MKMNSSAARQCSDHVVSCSEHPEHAQTLENFKYEHSVPSPRTDQTDGNQFKTLSPGRIHRSAPSPQNFCSSAPQHWACGIRWLALLRLQTALRKGRQARARTWCQLCRSRGAGCKTSASRLSPGDSQLHPCVLDAVNKHAGAPVLAFGAHETTTPFRDPGASSPTPPLRTPHRLATAKSRRSPGTRMFDSPLIRTRVICLCSSHS